MRSKAALLLAIQELENRYPNLYYFPVYEIFMDELRDYRFYASDMLHPSDFAIEYIWEYFQQTFFSQETIAMANSIEKIKKSLEHRPIHATTGAYQTFIGSLKRKIEVLDKAHPWLDFKSELKNLFNN